jgi:hypothetical protein
METLSAGSQSCSLFAVAGWKPRPSSILFDNPAPFPCLWKKDSRQTMNRRTMVINKAKWSGVVSGKRLCQGVKGNI